MPPIDIGPHGGGDLPRHPDTPPDHSIILGHINDLPTSIRDLLNEAKKKAGSSDAAQQKSDSSAQLEIALAEVQRASGQLQEVEGQYGKRYAGYEQQYWREMKRNGPVLSGRVKQNLQGGQQILDTMKLSIHAALDTLGSTLENFERTIGATFAEFREAIATQTETRRSLDPRLEAELLDANVLVVQTQIRALREQLGRPASPNDSAPPPATFPTDDLPLGYIDLGMHRNETIWLQRVQGAIIKLYRSLEQDPENTEALQRLDIVKNVFDSPLLRESDTALDKIDHLYNLFYENVNREDVEPLHDKIRFALFASPEELDLQRRLEE